MKKQPQILLILFLLIFLNSCRQKSFDKFDFSFENTFETDFSISFNKSDTVFIRENWSRNDIYDNIPAPKSKTNYFSILTTDERKKLDSFLITTNFKRYNVKYSENFTDGSAYCFYYKKNEFEKKIFVRSLNPPKELDDFAYWIYTTKKKLKLTKIKKELKFKSNIYNPPPPPPTL